MSFGSAALQPKRLGLLNELVPPPATIVYLRDPNAPSFEIEARDVEAAARELGRNILSLKASSAREIDAAFATIVQSRAGALLIGNTALFTCLRIRGRNVECPKIAGFHELFADAQSHERSAARQREAQ